MTKRSQFTLLTALGGLAVLLVLLNAGLAVSNRTIQAEFARRQQFVQQTVPLESLYRDIIKSLADLAVKGSDRQVVDMLAAQGITLNVGDGGPASADAAAKKGEK